MNEKSFEFNRFTFETKKRIKERILNEKYQNEYSGRPKKNLFAEIFKNKSKKRRTSNSEEVNEQKVPDKYLEMGRSLPKKYERFFSPKLSGIPLEEIDDFYKTDFVRIIYKAIYIIYG